MKKMKRILALALMLVMLVSALPLSAQAYAPLTDSYDRSADVSLGMYSEEELAAFPVKDFLDLIGVSGAAKIAWSRETSDDYTVVDAQSGTMDLRFADGRQSYAVYLVTGDRALHADHRYRVDVDNGFLKDSSVYYAANEDGTLAEVPNLYTYHSTYRYSSGKIEGISYGFSFYPNVGSGDYVVKYTPGVEGAKVYQGEYASADAAKASGKEVTPEENQLAVKLGDNSFCFVYTLNGKEQVRNVRFYLSVNTGNVNVWHLTKDGSSLRTYVSYNYGNEGIEEYTLGLYSEDAPLDAEYGLVMHYYGPSGGYDVKVKSAYVDGGTTDIKDELFGSSGYVENYSGNGHLFVITDTDDNEYRLRVKLTKMQLGSDEGKEYYNGDTHFQAKTAALDEGERVNSYLVMPPDADSLYSASENCYQTILLKPDTALDMSQLKPIFWVANGTLAYAKSVGEVAAVKQTSGVNVVDFTTSPVEYTARDSRGTAIKNYWVTYVQKQTAPTLFVNGPSFDSLQTGEVDEKDKREVILTGTDSYHDVFFANLGGSELTGLRVSLDEEAQKTLKLDDFWTVADGDRFDAFRYTSRYNADNISKIRLRLKDAPENLETSEISGVLTVASDAGTRYVYLTGTIAPEIVTQDMPDGVKYVPYSVMIQTNNHSDSNTVTYSLESGRLPAGVTLNSATGEIYGVPTQTGTYAFTIKASFSNAAFAPVTKDYSIEILDNTDENVDASCDDTILDRVYTMGDENDDWHGEYHDQVFRIDRAFNQFVKFFLDGEELVNGEDFDAVEGSTKITIRAKTFKRAGRGKHTIAAEFRESDRVMKKDAQNYVSNVEDSTPVNPNPTKPVQNPTNNNTNTPAGTFDDVRKGDWFYDNVMWAYEQKYMVGVSSRLFAPKQNITQAMAVTVLARLADAELKSFEKAGETAQWYTTAARWADSIGLIELSEFAPAEPLPRGELAIMLVKLFDEIKVEYVKPDADEKTVFSDAAQMTAAEEDAFQTLYYAGIFRGNGKNDMQPDASTTRAQFAALIQRVSEYIDRRSGENA